MRIARVIGSVVATKKDRTLEGAKLLLTQPVDRDGRPMGATQLAVDAVGAGVGELVLLVLEGRAAGAALGRRAAPVDAALVGIVDPNGLVD
ncbi:MAG: ethanolamine utilization protein EutN [Acidobacteria bacterium]|jgi:ethanolamine utilization protein EutN|nr:ethanolamine utilization protein EutN [Acidobacteriota bacterium]MBQ01621.1 ethanolamine utilization protein EutN [Acidobacteriota bacterium]MDP7480738.1 EutN/CcmL family microcompartment protein [Vicinamibacterales bacterium]MDP7690579.1 EutN/CcmL family microcompartment protein [Vicinamibacterales bacterium]HJN45618.1 EutN/CcmL family microcompartment protein [Vicinamibacterales bacterium]|tara:strand:- start:206 stop:478 length:273 start_codon:yes stop_codon:yes gene_type:complete